MRRMVNGILRQYGTVMTLTHEGVAREIRGFFQPFRSKSLQSVVPQQSPLGQLRRGQYSFIGSADVPLAEDDVLTLDDKQYCIRRVEPYHYGGESVYIWALCMEKGGDDTWAAES